MRIYFTADEQAEERYQKVFSRIIKRLNEAGVVVMSNLANPHVSGFSSQDLERIEESGEVLLERVDAIIIEGSKPLPESGYVIALALAHHKPILYLTERQKPMNKNLAHLVKNKSTAKLLMLAAYTEASLEKVIAEFLQGIEQGEGRELPTIKFTLRITPLIERYLHYKTHNTKLSKADFLREQIEHLIDHDNEYKKFTDRQSK